MQGRGCHAAQPRRTPDAILAASALASQLHTIVSRCIDPSDTAVLSVTRIERVELTGTVRSFDPAMQDAIESAMRQVTQGVALASGTEITLDYIRYYPATINHAQEAELALAAAADAGLHASVSQRPAFTSEDFAFMLRERPGAYLWLGHSRGCDEDVPLHHPRYDFNDDALGWGTAWFTAVAQRALPTGT